MRPITDKIVKELRSRNISLDSYVNDEVVKALLDNDFSHDYILKSIDEGDIKLDKKPEDIEKEDVEKEGVKKCDKMKKSDAPIEEEDAEKGEEKYEKIKKADNEEDIEARVEKSIRRTLRKSFGAQLSELNGLVKSLQDEISTLKNERAPFRTVNSSAIIEKSMNLGKDNDGKSILSKAMNRIQIGKELTKAFEEEQDSEIKKSLGSDILGFSVSGGDLSKDSIEVLEKRGYKIVD